MKVSFSLLLVGYTAGCLERCLFFSSQPLSWALYPYKPILTKVSMVFILWERGKKCGNWVSDGIGASILWDLCLFPTDFSRSRLHPKVSLKTWLPHHRCYPATSLVGKGLGMVYEWRFKPRAPTFPTFPSVRRDEARILDLQKSCLQPLW